MHFTSVAVLSTLAAAGNVAASNLHHGHASFHARRDVEAKRQYEKVNWADALKDVDWSRVNFGGDAGAGAGAGAAAPAAPAATDAPAEVNIASAPKSKPSAPAPPAPPAPAPPAPAKSSSYAASKPSSTPAAAPTPSSKPGSGGPISDLLNIGAFSKLGVFGNTGVNAKASGDNIWLGDDGKFKATFTNDGNDAVALLCWGASALWVNAKTPEIFVQVPGGKSVTVSIPQGKSGGCGAALPDSSLWMGLLNESILEFTANGGANGAFDISREINMKGVVLTAKGKQCTSGVVNNKLSCVFVCNSGTTCEKAGSYAIALGSAIQGPCMVGKASDGGASGGCQFADNGETLQVTIAGHRQWPSS